MNKTVVLVLFTALCLVQFVVPASMIYKRETTLRHGEVFKFRTAPIDPYDAFRGRYVALNYAQSTISGHWPTDEYRRGRIAYAVLERDDEGYARITDVRLGRPDNQMFLKVRIGGVRANLLTLHLPFDRYYMDEFEAPEAEREFMRQRRNRQERTAYARTRVHQGFGVIEELMVEEKPIREWLMSKDDAEP